MTTYNANISYNGNIPSLPQSSVQTLYNGSMARTFWREGGSDYVPGVYTYASATTVWNPPDQDQQGAYFLRCVPSVTWQAIVVEGNSTETQRQIVQYGVVKAKITVANVGMTRAPAFVDVIANGLHYKIQPNSTCTMPANVFNLLNGSGDYQAGIVP